MIYSLFFSKTVMIIFVKDISGKTMEINVNTGDSVASLKTKV